MYRYEDSEIKDVKINYGIIRVALFSQEPGGDDDFGDYVRVLIPGESSSSTYDRWVRWSDPEGETTALLQRAGVREV